MARFQVLLTDYAWTDLVIERWTLTAGEAELVVAEAADEVSLARQARDCHAILTCWAKVSRAVIEAAGHCRVISRLGIGLDNIDLAAAAERGMFVTNVPNYCQTEVAEHTLALIFALGRKIAFYHQQTKLGRYDLQAGPPLRRMAGQTLGIIGLGSIGREVARRALAQGMQVLAHSRSMEQPPPGVTWASLGSLLAGSDYVSLHLPLAAETRNLIGAAELALMRPTAFLINTARGGLVNHAALSAALASGRLAGAALDVQEVEPPDLTQMPYCHERVIVTPHAAFSSVESLQTLRTIATEQVVDVLLGRIPPHAVIRPA